MVLMIKVSILALMDSTCYSFGGKIFKQLWGAGIGLRASACMAKIVMGLIDKMWSEIQITWNLKIYLYFRYIDDLRIFLHPISEGWSWEDTGWVYTETTDTIERTKQEISKSLNAYSSRLRGRKILMASSPLWISRRELKIRVRSCINSSPN